VKDNRVDAALPQAASQPVWSRLVRAVCHTDHCRAQFQAAGLAAPGSDRPEPWLEACLAARIVPTPFFDEAYYLAANPDVATAGMFGFDHFVHHGVAEGRRPNLWFDSGWYGDRAPGRQPDTPAFLHFLEDGAATGTSPTIGLRALDWPIDPAAMHAACLTLDRLLRPLAARLTALQCDRLLSLFRPEFYGAAAGLPPGTPALELLGHYLAHGLALDLTPSPLFEADRYAAFCRAEGLPAPAEPAVLHWITRGIAAGVVPVSWFDAAGYGAPGVDGRPVERFLHFVGHGLYEGRRGTSGPVIELAGSASGDARAVARQGLLLSSGLAPANHPAAEQARLALLAATQRRVSRRLAAADLAVLMTEAQALDPGVGSIADLGPICAAPFHDPIDALHRAMVARLARTQYDTVICVPWLRNGGADLVAGLLTQALARLFPAETVLLLRTDFAYFDRPDWIAPGTDVLDLSDILTEAGDALAERLLHTLLLGLAPRRVININSLRTWRAWQRFGRRLAERMDLFAYLFCWDRSPAGVATGYVTEFFPHCAPDLSGVFTDNLWLKAALERMYALPPALARRLVSLPMPPRLSPASPTMAELGAAGSRARPTVLWGGRLDRQKRFDIVQDVARLMPDLDFRCWGTALLDPAPDLRTLPPNVTMHGTFRSPADLPLGGSDGWLFTSDWEGMPNLVIELATLGMPLVASSVGDVPTLVDETTGWPVASGAPVSAYVAAVRDMVDNPARRVERAARLQRKAGSMFTAARHDSRLADALSQLSRAGRNTGP
jgi:glycosyltransferase involved in cell wall biosynthesis